jgi:acetyl esterase/lipase
MSSPAESPGGVVRVRSAPYGHGKLLDIYQPQAAGPVPVVLLWHGRGGDERDLLAPLASATAALGAVVCVPDWSAAGPDRGRAQLLASLTFARDHAPLIGGDPARIVLAGWSMGARAAAGVAVRPSAAGGWRPAAVVCLAGGFSAAPAPTTGTPPLADLRRGGAAPAPFWLVHGTGDPVVPGTESRIFAAELTSSGWPVRLSEPDTDHMGVVMAEFDQEAGRCMPARAAHAVEAGRLSARILAGAARRGAAGPGGSAAWRPDWDVT